MSKFCVCATSRLYGSAAPRGTEIVKVFDTKEQAQEWVKSETEYGSGLYDLEVVPYGGTPCQNVKN